MGKLRESKIRPIENKLYAKFLKNRNEKTESYINLTKVSLNALNVSLKGFIIEVKN